MDIITNRFGLGMLGSSGSGDNVFSSEPADQADFDTELQASRVYARTRRRTAPSASSSSVLGRKPRSLSSSASIFEAASLTSSLTLLDSRRSTNPSENTIIVLPQTAASAAEHSVDAALYSFRTPSIYSTSRTLTPPTFFPNNSPHEPQYHRPLDSLPHPLSRPLPAGPAPSIARINYNNFAAQRARPRPLSSQAPTITDIQNQINFIYACRYGDVNTVAALLSQGVDPNTRDSTTPWPWSEHGAAAIHIATMKGHYDVVRILLHHGARADEPFRGFRRPLHEAVRRGDSSLTVLLLDNGAAVDARDESGYQPLHVACMEEQVTCAKLLLFAGAPVNVVGNDFLTPLHLVATVNGSMELVELLVSNGADVRVRTRWLLGNKLAREIAREKGYEEVEARLAELEEGIEQDRAG
ncbi:MAG: hypothetical protein LQ340_004910 [Diploschistes diacapsis]|nr:MAG: hypothetical protein LQ340_004910 [Diploschistes diacapsis]